jgi:TonB family protein
MGEKGFVVLAFHIQRDGKIPDSDPTLERTSHSKELDDAAVKAVQTSVPFAPLPETFHGPNLELRFVFMYNAAKPKSSTHPADCENNPPGDRSEPRLVPIALPPHARVCNVT